MSHLRFPQESSGENQSRAASGRTVPLNWAHGHNHCILTFRLYFNGDKMDPNFPAPAPPRPLKVPTERPKHGKGMIMSAPGMASPFGMAPMSMGLSSSVPTDPLDQRRKLLQEVREHLDLLKEVEGVISEEDLAERKRNLFMALPPAPPPAKDGKRPKLDDGDIIADAV